MVHLIGSTSRNVMMYLSLPEREVGGTVDDRVGVTLPHPFTDVGSAAFSTMDVEDGWCRSVVLHTDRHHMST